ncbi:MAG: M3 family metallopeptidase [Acidimicrobiaceae bacterium]|nr:M3 family metallopeptidase [Acidimicrobiaceae bacterium]MCO4832072.1 M3 family metallopeptidase [Acidimicrobiaceae bacterium]
MSDTATPLARLELTTTSGTIAHLPVWAGIAAADVEPGVTELVDMATAEFAALEESLEPTWAGLMEPLERIEHRLEAVIGAITHLTSVKYSDEMQEAYDAVRPAIVAMSNTMSQSRAVYDAMVALRDSDEGQNLSVARARILDESIRGMERSGVALTGAQQDRYKEIKNRLAEISNTFSTNLIKEERESRVKVTDEARLDGVPDAVIEIAKNQAIEDGAEDAWHFQVNGVSYLGICQNGTNRSLREDMLRAFRTRGVQPDLDNRPILKEILELRQEQAQLVGFANYAELSLDAKMAPSVEAVWELLDQLEHAARPFAEIELESLTAFMVEQGAEGADDPQPWDTAYWAERQQEALYSYDAEVLRDYFQLPKVLGGLFDLVTKLYGVEIAESTDASVPVWDESVQFFEVRRDGNVIAAFYVDPYSRPGEKRGGAWMNTVVGRDRLLATGDADSSLPVALFVMNARPPADGRPGLMSLDEVRTLFHEFGHATQHMFTEIDEGGASGMNLVEWDSVELASQFNEYWMEHKPFLRALTAHVDTGEPLDDETLDRIIDSRNFMVANATLRQLHFAKSDLTLHQRFGIDDSIVDPQALDIELGNQILVTPRLEGESMLPAFGHIFAGGYAAGYYSYKWAEVLAADAFAAFREAGLDNEAELAEVASRFRETVLGLGGSRPAAEVYRLFRGRDATPDALLADQGLVSPAS